MALAAAARRHRRWFLVHGRRPGHWSPGRAWSTRWGPPPSSAGASCPSCPALPLADTVKRGRRRGPGWWCETACGATSLRGGSQTPQGFRRDVLACGCA